VPPVFTLLFTPEARKHLRELESDPSRLKQLKAVRRSLGLMESNLRHPSLNTHNYEELTRQMGKDVFEAYLEQRTPAAYRIFWCYGPGRREITILAVTPHP
jgi:hypothetical protein